MHRRKRYNMKRCLALFLPVLLLLANTVVHSQAGDSELRGDRAVADRYALWAKNAVEEGRWEEALAALERASDFADVSSDIAYLLALALYRQNQPRSMVLSALEKALEVNSWTFYDSESTRLLKAENLIAIKAYTQAILELSKVHRSPKETELLLKALISSNPEEFRRSLEEALDRYPRETAPVRLFFRYLKGEDAAGRNPGTIRRDPAGSRFPSGRDDIQILELIQRRLPVLVSGDPDLAWIAAPYMRDTAEAKRLVMAYRAVNTPSPESLPAALKLGVIDDESALEELFPPESLYPLGSLHVSDGAFPSEKNTTLDLTLLVEIWGLLRRNETRTIFARNLQAYSGVITEDANGDGIPEIFSEYSRGMLRRTVCNEEQDGVPGLIVHYDGGDPRRALVRIPGDAAVTRGVVTVQWERYPSLLEAELDGGMFIPRPLDFHYSPLLFDELFMSGVLFPRRDPNSPPLTRRVLVSNSLRFERPSLEFSGGTEQVELNQGIPVRAREFVGDLMVSETEFLRGRPLLQRVDLDMDGRMDTARHFNRNYRPVELEDLLEYEREFDYIITIGDD